MADYGHIYTEEQIKDLDRRIHAIYSEAQKDIEKKLNSFLEAKEVKESIYLQKLRNGDITQEDFNQWMRGQVFQENQWRAKQDQIIKTINNSNNIAVDIINNRTQGVFGENATYMNYTLEHGANINFGFGIYDSNTVARIIDENPQILPRWKINEQKDYIWNKKIVNNAVNQGIIQGESLDKIIKRISDGMCMKNENLAKTFARTAMTEAQNAGRLQSLEDANARGINTEKEWLATLDSHTRDSHADIDGESVPVEKPFSNGLMYPGDPNGDPSEVYNCRCTMIGNIKKYPSFYERYDNIAGKPIAGMTYKQWKDAKSGIGVNTLGDVYNSTFKTVVDGTTHWTRLSHENNHKFPSGAYNKTYKRDADIYTLDDGVRVIYPSDINTTKQDLKPQDIVNKLYEIPEDFRSIMQKDIYVVDYHNASDAYWRKRYKNFTHSYATGGDEIMFYAYTGHDMDYLKDTLCHEGGHFLDEFIAGTRSNPFSNSVEWINATMDDLALIGFGVVTPYGANAATEDFAESCMMLLSRDPKMMKKQFPNRTKVLKALIKKYKKTR